MNYLIYSEVDDLANDFAIKLARYLKEDNPITIIDLDSNNRKITREFKLEDYTIFDIEDVLNGMVTYKKARIEIEEGIYLISSSIINKYDYSKDINIDLDGAIILVRKKENIEKVKGVKIFSITNKLGKYPGNLVSYDLDSKEEKILSKDNMLVSSNSNEDMVKKALEGKKIVFKGFLARLIGKIFGK